ncbi:MAG: hypothetical protein R3185_00540 [Candidatus Thermoplasmatota archaeon]|nr:hypothetical protein [Candidatus Thermoplasmatota archaeon]
MVSQLAMGMVAFLPAVAILYAYIGPHDKHFRHNAMFMVLVGSLALGLAAGFAELFIITDAGLLLVVFALPLVETMAKTMLVGLPRFRGRAETVLLGGAVGLGTAAMIFMTYAQVIRMEPDSWRLWTTLVAVSIGFTLTHFISGLMLGQGPAEGKVLGQFLSSYLILLPAHGLLIWLGLAQGLAYQPFVNYNSIEIGLLLAAYGVLLTWRMAGPLIRLGLPAQEKARMRREARAERMKEA